MGRSAMLAESDIRASSRSSARMSVFDMGVVSTGQFEVANNAQLSVREVMLLLVSMLLNAMVLNESADIGQVVGAAPIATLVGTDRFYGHLLGREEDEFSRRCAKEKTELCEEDAWIGRDR